MKLTRKVGAHVSTSGGPFKAIENAREIGANCFQFFAGSPRMWARSLYPPPITTNFQKLTTSYDLLPVYIHALYLTNLASDNPELRDKSRKALITDLVNSAALGSAGVILHIGSHQGRGWAATRSLVISQIKQTLAATPADSVLILENSAGQKGKIGSLPELAEILEAIPTPRLQVCLDTAHAFEAGYNLATASGLAIWLADIKKYVGDKLVVLHVNDSKTRLGSGNDKHENIGNGYIGVEGLRRLLTHPALSHLPIILEVPGLEGGGPDRENIARIRELIQST